MKLYKIKINPTSNFSSSLKGDQLFGQFCWAIKFKFGNERLKELLNSYQNSPFIVFSDAFVSGFLPKPNMPSVLLGEDSDNKKENRKKIWLTLDELKEGGYSKARTEKDLPSDKKGTIIRNSINYLSSRTGDDGFDPYSKEEISLSQKDIYILIDETQFSIDEFKKAFKMLSSLGYGTDTTIGKGRFKFNEIKEINIDCNSTSFMTISPFTAEGLECKEIFYTPFTKFGKSGYDRATTNAFKKPLLLADTKAVIVFKERQNKQYIGKAIKNISTYNDIVHQGYAIIVPIKDIDAK